MNCNDITAVVEHNYTQKEHDELSLIKGETIFQINKLTEGWWEGVNLVGKKGMFPENFVRIVDDNEVILRDKNVAVHRKCKAIYSYDQNKEDELTLVVGDVVEVFGEAEEGWWQGQLNGKKGVFPSNFVTLIEHTSTLETKSALPDNIPKTNSKTMNFSKTFIQNSSETHHSEVPSLPPKRQKELCLVEFAYSPQNEDELELNVGDIITIVSKEAQDIGWWKGDINGKVGVFPDNFVKLLPTEGISKSTSSSKIYIKSDRKNNSFGSKDSLKDILNETGLQIGNVVQQRLSLEIKNLDFSNSVNDNSNDSETQKPTEFLEDKRTIPPTLPKKPFVPSKKTPNVTSVAGNIISGIQKSGKTVEQRFQLASSTHDIADGISSSKAEIADNFNKNIKMEKIKIDDDFDNVERTTTMLQDVRAGRIKAPKRRPPTSNTFLGNENNNYINGVSYNENVEVVKSQVYIKAENEENNKISKNIAAKINAPWMAELKANQRKKIPLKKEIVSNSTSTPETSIQVYDKVITTETTSTISVQAATLILDNPKVPNLTNVQKEKDKATLVSLPSKPIISNIHKEHFESPNNILIQNNNNKGNDSHITETNQIRELEKRIQTLESIVEQLKQEILFIKNSNENQSIAKVVKNEIEKYV